MLTTQDKLSRIARYRTRYELVMRHPDGRKYLVKYTESASRRSIVDCVQSVGRAIVAAAGLDDDAELRFSGKGFHGHKAVVGDWTIEFSGRTQRDAIMGGELPFVGDL